MPSFIYGYDPICGWCYGAAPAVRVVAQHMPVQIVMAGLVTGPRVGPAADKEGYVRQAAQRLNAVTGRAPSEAFFEWMRKPSSVAASGPPSVAVNAVLEALPNAAPAFAHAVTEAHYAQGMDPNDPDAYAPILAAHAPCVTLPDIHDPVLQDAAFAKGRAMGITSFPTFILEHNGSSEVLPTLYNPEALLKEITSRIT